MTPFGALLKKLSHRGVERETLILPKQDSTEWDELCVDFKGQLWLWTVVSRYTGQILAWCLGDHKWHHVEELYDQLPRAYRYRLVYTDGHESYPAFFSAWQHRLCVKGDGGTCTVEGVNTSFRHRCSFLVRRACGAKVKEWLERRLPFVVARHNQDCKKRWERKYPSIIKGT
jgi:IS1 family transposase